MEDFLYPLGGMGQHRLERNAGSEAAVFGKGGEAMGNQGWDQDSIIRMLTGDHVINGKWSIV